MKSLCGFLTSTMHATCPLDSILPDLIVLIYDWHFWFCSYVHPSIISCLFVLFLSTRNTVFLTYAFCISCQSKVSCLKLHASFWVILLHPNFMCQRFRTPCLFHLHRHLWRYRVGQWNGKKVRGGWAHCSRVGRWGPSLSPSVAPTI